MSDPAHLVISFGGSIIHLYRHLGGSINGMGPLLIEALEAAVDVDPLEASQVHQAGRLIKFLCENKTEFMQLLEVSTKHKGGIKDDFQFTTGLIGQGWSNGYHLQFFPIEDDTPLVENKGRWIISFATDLEGYELLSDWLPTANKYSVEEFKKFVWKNVAADAAND